MQDLLAELKRRKVLRVAFAYLVSAWALIQVADLVGSAFDAPGWVMPMVITLLTAGLVPALVLAWIYNLTSEGVQRDRGAPVSASPRRTMRGALSLPLIAVGVVVLAGLWTSSRRAPDTLAGAPGADEPAGAPAAARSLVVLPFLNMWARIAWQPAMLWLREDPRFLELMREAGIVDLWRARGYPAGCAIVAGDGGRDRLACGARSG